MQPLIECLTVDGHLLWLFAYLILVRKLIIIARQFDYHRRSLPVNVVVIVNLIDHVAMVFVHLLLIG